MKRAITALLLAVLIGLLFGGNSPHAQTSPQISGAGAPANALCTTSGMQYVDTTNRLIYNCNNGGPNGAWVLIGLGTATNNQPLTASLTTTAAASDPVTLSGITTAGHCSVTPTNAGAAGGIASVFYTLSSNTVTVSHTATAGWTFSIICTLN